MSTVTPDGRGEGFPKREITRGAINSRNDIDLSNSFTRGGDRFKRFYDSLQELAPEEVVERTRNLIGAIEQIALGPKTSSGISYEEGLEFIKETYGGKKQDLVRDLREGFSGSLRLEYLDLSLGRNRVEPWEKVTGLDFNASLRPVMFQLLIAVDRKFAAEQMFSYIANSRHNEFFKERFQKGGVPLAVTVIKDLVNYSWKQQDEITHLSRSIQSIVRWIATSNFYSGDQQSATLNSNKVVEDLMEESGLLDLIEEMKTSRLDFDPEGSDYKKNSSEVVKVLHVAIALAACSSRFSGYEDFFHAAYLENNDFLYDQTFDVLESFRRNTEDRDEPSRFLLDIINNQEMTAEVRRQAITHISKLEDKETATQILEGFLDSTDIIVVQRAVQILCDKNFVDPGRSEKKLKASEHRGIKIVVNAISEKLKSNNEYGLVEVSLPLVCVMYDGAKGKVCEAAFKQLVCDVPINLENLSIANMALESGHVKLYPSIEDRKLGLQDNEGLRTLDLYEMFKGLGRDTLRFLFIDPLDSLSPAQVKQLSENADHMIEYFELDKLSDDEEYNKNELTKADEIKSILDSNGND